MKQKTLFFALLFFSLLNVNSQTDFSEIDEYARSAPDSKASNIETLSAYLTANATTDTEKIRALYVWITDNIKYDTKLYFNDKIDPIERAERQESERVLKYKKAVCEGYSNLFNDLASAANIPSEKVSGFTKNHRGRVARIGHAWNAVQADGKWYLIDNTWGAGYVDDENNRFKRQFEEKYFLAEPSEFVLDHYPNDPLFQMLPNPINWDVFQEDNSTIKTFLKSEKTPEFESFTDSLNHFHSLKGNTKTFNSAARTLRFDPANGYANYLIANYYYDESRKDFDAYRKETEPIVHNPKKLESKHITKWSKMISLSETKLEKAKEYLDKIEPGNKFFRSSRAAKKNANLAMNNIRNAKTQIKQFKDYLRRRG